MEYDIVIVGAGIPGLYAARQLAQAGFKTIILDQVEKPGEPNYSTAGIPISTLAEFNLPKEGVAASVHKIIFATKKTNVVWSAGEIVSHVLDFRKMKQLLASELEKSGGEVKWGVSASGLLFAEHKIIGVKTTIGEIFGKYFIDATGHVGTLAVAAGVRPEIPGKISEGIEYIVQIEKEKINIYADSLAYFLDRELAPYGYAWIFDQGNNFFKIGIGEDKIDSQRKLPSLTQRLDNFIDWLGIKDSVKIVEKHGCGKFLGNYFPKVRFQNLLAIGDVIGAINPFLGEGIRHGLCSAKFAVSAIKSGNLENYEKTWKKYKGSKWIIFDLIRTLFYRNLSDNTQKLYEEFAGFGRKYMTINDVLDFDYEYDLRVIFKKLPGNIPLLWTALKTYFS